MSQVTRTFCDLCGKEISNKSHSHYSVRRIVPTFKPFTQYIDVHDGCMEKLFAAIKENEEKTQNEHLN